MGGDPRVPLNPRAAGVPVGVGHSARVLDVCNVEGRARLRLAGNREVPEWVALLARLAVRVLAEVRLTGGPVGAAVEDRQGVRLELAVVRRGRERAGEPVGLHAGVAVHGDLRLSRGLRPVDDCDPPPQADLAPLREVLWA